MKEGGVLVVLAVLCSVACRHDGQVTLVERARRAVTASWCGIPRPWGLGMACGSFWVGIIAGGV